MIVILLYLPSQHYAMLHALMDSFDVLPLGACPMGILLPSLSQQLLTADIALD